MINFAVDFKVRQTLMTFKKIITSAMVLSICFLTSSAAETPPTNSFVMSLDSCISIALNDNPKIKIADMEVQRVDYSRRETLGQLLPTVQFGANYNRMLAKQVTYMNMDRFGSMDGGSSISDDNDGSSTESRAGGGSGNNTGIKMGLDNSYSLGFSAGLPLIAPQLWKALKISDSQIALQLETARNSRLEMVNSVKSAYYTLLLAIDSRKTIQESYDMAKFTADIYAKQFELGTASRYDVLRTEVAVKNVEPELSQADIAIKQARLQLAVLMGLDGSIAIEPDRTLADYENTMYADALSAAATAKETTDNPSLRLLEAQTVTAARTLDMQKAAWWPTLSASVNYNWTSSSDGSPFKNFRWNPYSVFGLQLTVPIFEGGQRYNRIRQARVQLDEMALQRADLTRSINMQIDLAIDNINTNVKQIASCSESVGQATTAHNIARQSFEIGAASYLELRDSELALTRSRLAYYQAIYNYLVARSELELLTGTFDLTPYTPAR